jgi:hypothetical protein
MRQSDRNLAIAAMALAAMCWHAGSASAQFARTIRISCIDAITGERIDCSAARIPPQTSTATPSRSDLEILDPIIRFRAEAKAAGYDAREIEVNAASFNTRDPQSRVELRIALAPSFQAGLRPTLLTINRARGLLDKENTIDRGLALMEQIDALTTESVGTFAVRRAYWRMVALFKTCTLSFYQTCNDATAALKALREAIAANPSEFSREGVTMDSLREYDLSIRAARLNKQIHRANWYLALNDFARARDEFQAARAELADGGPALAGAVRMTLQIIDENLRLVDTREKQQEKR